MNILNGKTITCPVCGEPTEVISWSVKDREKPGTGSFMDTFKQREADPNTQVVKFLCGHIIDGEFARQWVDKQQQGGAA